MNFVETRLAGAFVIDIEPISDERGFLARTFCRKEFEALDLNSKFVQCSLTVSDRKGTVRGMHFQRPPYQEVKLVRCTSGAVYDVIIDLRPDSPTFQQHFSVELSAANHRAIYVPPGFAHGLQNLQDDAEVLYQMSEYHHPEAATGVRWDDRAFNINWPLEVTRMSPRDSSYADFSGSMDSRLRPQPNSRP